MKTLILLALFFISCNDHKDPPDDQLERIAKLDSLRIDSLINKP